MQTRFAATAKELAFASSELVALSKENGSLEEQVLFLSQTLKAKQEKLDDSEVDYRGF